MSEDNVGLLTVLGSYEGDLEADRADVHITVKGFALFSGDMGATTVKEAEELTTELKRIGVREDEIHVNRVAMGVHSHAVGKSSSATCRLRVQCTNLSKLTSI